MDYAHFIVQFPEFRNVPASLIQVHLDAAALEMDVKVWGQPASGTSTPTVGTKYDQGHGYLTAHKLALSPFGQNVRMNPKQVKDGSMTTYWVHYQLLVNRYVTGFRAL